MLIDGEDKGEKMENLLHIRWLILGHTERNQSGILIKPALVLIAAWQIMKTAQEVL